MLMHLSLPLLRDLYLFFLNSEYIHYPVIRSLNAMMGDGIANLIAYFKNQIEANHYIYALIHVSFAPLHHLDDCHLFSSTPVIFIVYLYSPFSPSLISLFLFKSVFQLSMFFFSYFNYFNCQNLRCCGIRASASFCRL